MRAGERRPMDTAMHDEDQQGTQKQSTANAIRLTVSHLAPFFLLPMVHLFGTPAIRCIYIIAVMILEWILEPVPYQITSFFPLIMGPLLNLTVTRDLAKFYFNEPIANSIAGLTVALIAQNCGLNKRISYNMILLVGPRIKWLMLSFMMLVFCLSMFVSNVAVTSIMMSIVDTLIFEISTTKLRRRINELLTRRDLQREGRFRMKSKQLRKTFLLSIGYAATLGGTSFVAGNRTNIQVLGYINRISHEERLTAFNWLLYCFPVCFFSTLLGWSFLYNRYLKEYDSSTRQHEKEFKFEIKQKLRGLPRTHAEVLSTFLYVLCIVLWVTRRPFFVRGWSDLLDLQEQRLSRNHVTDSSVGFLIAFIAFMIPVKSFNFSLEHRLMEWKFIQKNMPWAIIFIIGGGSTLTEIIQKSELFTVIFDKFGSVSLGPIGNMIVAVLVTSLVTEFTNEDVTTFGLLALAEKKQEADSTSPLFYALPMAMANNFAFILPSSEAWNSIVFEIGGLSVGDM
ncbi:unnamed protein product, partial [Ixodes hexagonus]